MYDRSTDEARGLCVYDGLKHRRYGQTMSRNNGDHIIVDDERWLERIELQQEQKAQDEAFDTLETGAVPEALGNQGVPTQYIRILRELYSNFTSRISPFYDDITIDSSGTYAGRLRRRVLKDRSPTESNEDNVHEE
ncbi:hypothetical protein ANCCEY_01634 [Ancylostoma ceylanicum]|uniref:Uncharacterized protein n=1 Tax=Ancylostoma ceylanicum TaxID=53326 RepID=A0A0D6MA24_9BILA|nr:hypothetical protein ANCCEY_01634 [Ancylostoma ceylanicum]